MKKMNKWIAILLVLAMVFSMAACGGNSSDTANSPASAAGQDSGSSADGVGDA